MQELPEVRNVLNNELEKRFHKWWVLHWTTQQHHRLEKIATRARAARHNTFCLLYVHLGIGHCFRTLFVQQTAFAISEEDTTFDCAFVWPICRASCMCWCVCVEDRWRLSETHCWMHQPHENQLTNSKYYAKSASKELPESSEWKTSTQFFRMAWEQHAIFGLKLSPFD